MQLPNRHTCGSTNRAQRHKLQVFLYGQGTFGLPHNLYTQKPSSRFLWQVLARAEIRSAGNWEPGAGNWEPGKELAGRNTSGELTVDSEPAAAN